MDVVIIGGNDRMVNEYKTVCKKYRCKPKVFTQITNSFKTKIGSPDLVIVFTSTVSHNMVHNALKRVSQTDAVVVRAQSDSINALKNILNQYCLAS